METVTDIPLEDLPIWMRRGRRGVDWGVLIVIVFSLAAAWSFIANEGLPHTNATENYVYRTADYAQALKEGRLYPRWSPHVFAGYGAPIPSYYPPGAAYSAAVIQMLFTDDSVAAVRVLYVLSLGLAGAMTYVFVTRWSGAVAGVLASVLYIYSPYVGLVSPHILGDLPGVITLALVPTLLWSVTRLIQLNRSFDVLFVAFSTAGLYLTDARIGNVALILMVFLVLWHYLTIRRRKAFFLLILAVFMGLGLAAFYWLPALLEQTEVQWRTPTISALPLRVTFPDVLLPIFQVDRAELIVTPFLRIGILGIVFALLGGLTIVFVRRCAGFHALFLVMGIVLLVVVVTVFPTEIELLGPIMFCLSIGGSAVIHLRDIIPSKQFMAWRAVLLNHLETVGSLQRLIDRILLGMLHPAAWKRNLLPVLLVFVLVGALPVWLSPVYPQSFGPVDAPAQVGYEQQGFGVAVLPPGMPIPATIPENLTSNRHLLSGYSSGDIDKIAPNQMTVDTQASVLYHASHSDRFQIRVNRPTTLSILTAFFPGWQAFIGDREVALKPNAETGLISVALPSTQGNELLITLGATPVRQAAWSISGVVFISLIGITLLRLRRSTSIYDDLEHLSPQEARLVAGVMLTYITILILFVLALLPFQLHVRPGYRLDNSFALQSRTNRGLEALSYRLDSATYQPGDELTFTLFWRTSRFLPANYQVQVFLRDSRQGISWQRSESGHPGGYPTRRWTTDHYVSDYHSIRLSRSIVPGEYQIAVEVYECKPDCVPNNRLTFFDETGNIIGSVLLLPTPITILPR